MKFYENPFSDAQVIEYGQTDRRRDMAKQIDAFLGHFNAIAPEGRKENNKATDTFNILCHLQEMYDSLKMFLLLHRCSSRPDSFHNKINLQEKTKTESRKRPQTCQVEYVI
jgi:hypothetical protein